MSVENQDHEGERPDDPVGYFIQDLTYHGKSERTREAYERVLRQFEAFLADPERNPAGEPLGTAGAGHRECTAWIHGLRGELAGSTIATYASYLHRFYAYMTQIGAFEANPMAVVMEELDETIETDPTRRDVGLGEMRDFVAAVTHPLDRAVIVTLLKTGMRVGELCNLDLRDLHLDHGDLRRVHGAPRPRLTGRPDSLFVAGDIARGDVVAGERRTAANKRKRSTVVPVDEELRAILCRWLAVRPDTISEAEPLFVGTASKWGERLTPRMVRTVVTSRAEAFGWYREGGTADENVTPHYFRHFFTTRLRDRTGDRGVVKYLRGDVASDVIDTYTHDWGSRVRDTYESNVYSLL